MTPPSAVEVAVGRYQTTRQIIECERCDCLMDGGNHPIPFAGPSPAEILIMLEAPAPDDDRAGAWAWSTPQGAMLRRGLKAAGIEPGTVAVCGAVQCAPGHDGKVAVRHLKACGGHRSAIVRNVQPEWILAMGATSLRALHGRGKISRLHGRWTVGRAGPAIRRNVFFTYHPAAGLRSPVTEGRFMDDMRTFGRIRADIRSKLAAAFLIA